MKYIKENSKKWNTYNEKLVGEILDNDDFTEIKHLRKELYMELSQAINELPEHYRIPIILFHYYDIKIKDISKKMGCSIGTIKPRLFNAKNILKEKISYSITIFLCAPEYFLQS